MMKKLLVLLFVLICSFAQAQIITFEDEDAKEGLLSQEPSIDTNNDGEISQEEASVVLTLDLGTEFINTFPEIVFFTSLEVLEIDRNFLESLDLSQAPNLKYVNAEINLLTEVIFYEGTTVFEYLNFNQNTLVGDITLDNPVTIEYFDVGANNVPTFIIENCPGIEYLDLGNGKTSNLLLDVGTIGDWNFTGCRIETFDFCFIQNTYDNAVVELSNQTDSNVNPYSVVSYNYDFDLNIEFITQGPIGIQTIEAIDCSIIDTDNDGQTDESEVACGSDPNDNTSLSEDFDNDGFPDCVDFDDDNDGAGDDEDAFPLDPTEDTDTDGDGVGNNADTDDDGDGQTDADEVACGSDPLDALSVSEDVNNNNIPDCVDETLSIENIMISSTDILYNNTSKTVEVITDTLMDTNFALYNLSGQKIANSDKTRISTEGLSKGVYIAQYHTTIKKILIF